MNGSLQKLLRLSAAIFLIAGVCNAAEFNGETFRITSSGRLHCAGEDEHEQRRHRDHDLDFESAGNR